MCGKGCQGVKGFKRFVYRFLNGWRCSTGTPHGYFAKGAFVAVFAEPVFDAFLMVGVFARREDHQLVSAFEVVFADGTTRGSTCGPMLGNPFFSKGPFMAAYPLLEGTPLETFFKRGLRGRWGWCTVRVRQEF